MHHVTPLIATLVAGLVLAFILSAIAVRLRISPLVGYVLAGVMIGPFTPGFVADQKIANDFAEIGVILLMFGVGLHFSLKHLMAVRKVAIPGAIGQIAVAIALGMWLAHGMGWSLGTGFVFGLALSVASTVVLLRALEGRRLVNTDRGRIAVGWLIVEDLVMIIALVLLPALATGGNDPSALGLTLGVTLLKVAGFVAFMLIVGRRVIPWALHWVAHTGSRELFRLSVLAIALGVALGSALLFDVSFALGAFFAGMILAESELSARAAEETLPLRDAFAVLFFVSVGMLFNPAILVEAPLALAATVAIIVVGKSIAAFFIVRAFGKSGRTALTISVSLAQIGEFSFILAALGGQLGLLPEMARDLILGGAILSILFNPILFALVDRYGGRVVDDDLPAIGGKDTPPAKGHVILVGHGRVGSLVGQGLSKIGEDYTLIEAEADTHGLPSDKGVRVINGNAADERILKEAQIDSARMIFVAIPEEFEAGRIVQSARSLNPAIHIVARAHSNAEVAHLKELGADQTIMGEREIARRMIDEASIGKG